MAREKQATRESEAAIVAAWEDHCYWSYVHHKIVGDIHTFSPRTFIRAGVWEVPDPDEEEAIDEAHFRGLWSRHILRERNWYIMSAITRHLMSSSKASDDPTTASPTRPPKIGVKVKRLDDDRFWHFAWSELYAARRQIEFLIAERPHKWIDDNTILVDEIVRITTDAPPTGLSEIMEHEFTERQRMWTPHALDMRKCIAIWMKPGAEYVSEWEQQVRADYKDKDQVEREKVEAKTAKLQAKADRKAADKPKREPKAPKPDGLIDLATLLAGTDVSPKEARNALRKGNFEKPSHGWSWSKKDADDIRPKLLKKVKELRK